MEATKTSDLVVRELTPEELRPILARPPFDQMELEPGAHVRVMGAFREERMVGAWMMYDAVHAEPVWIAEEERANPAVARPLWEGVRRILVESGCPIAYVVMGDGGLPTAIPLATRLGFKPMGGNLFYLLVGEARSLAKAESE